MRRERSFVVGGRGSIAVSLVVFVALLLLGGCGGGEEGQGSVEEEPAEGGSAQSVEEETTATSAPEETGSSGTDSASGDAAAVGEVVSVEDVQWSVTDAEASDELLSLKGEYEEGSFVIADVAFRNNSNQDITLATPFVTLLDGEGREFEPNIDLNFTFLYPEENMLVGQIPPGDTRAGKIIFTVEPDASDLEMQVNGARFASQETARFDLEL